MIGLNNRELIYQSVELIEEKIKSDLSVYDISQQLGFSLYYFSRLFKGITGFSPKTYILNRKVTESVDQLLNSKKKIIDIAFEYGFGSSESYSRAFQKIMGISPSDIRKNGKVNRNKMYSPITRERIRAREDWPVNEPEFVCMDSIQLVGIPFYYELCFKKDLLNPWQNLIDHVSAIPHKIFPEKYYQVQYWFPEQDAGSLFFFIAVEVDQYKDIPIQFTAKTIPEHQYLKFLRIGTAENICFIYQYIYEEWLPETSYKLPYLFNFEYYGDLSEGLCNEDSISEIYIPVES